MARRFVDYDPGTKTTTYLHSSDERYVLEAVQDVEGILEYNQEIARNHDKKKERWFIGTIPLQICQQWAQESSTKVFTKPWVEYAKKRVQNPDFRKLNPNNIKL